MQTFTVGLFRTQFPEFRDTVTYPDQTIDLWATLAQQQVRECVWKKSWLLGVSLYVAHELTMAGQNAKAAAAGGTPGTSGGVANTKTVGTVTVGYDSTVTSEEKGGWWNLSNYGKQFLRLARIFGAAAIQL
jgi:hypothetical protein